MNSILLITVAVLLLTVLILIITPNQESNGSIEGYNQDKKRFKQVDPSVITQIYKLLYLTDKIFTKNKLEYWINGGTLLGAIRHKGIIPWDDDGDLTIWSKDEDLLNKLVPEFEKHNMVLVKTWFGYKLFFKDAKKIKGYEWSYPSIDIFPVMQRVNSTKLKYSFPKGEKTFGSCNNDLLELYPLTRYKFGSFNLVGPCKKGIESYFKTCYGDDWNTHAYMTFDHENEKLIDKVKIKLLDSERCPAEPIEFT